MLKEGQLREIAGLSQEGLKEMGFGRIDIGAIEKVQFPKQFLEEIRKAGKDDWEYLELWQTAEREPEKDPRSPPDYTVENGILYWRQRLMVPKKLRERVLKEEHDLKVAGHWGAGKTVEIITRNFAWPKMDEEIRKYVSECGSCQRNKATRHKRNGLRHPLELPASPCTSISMDFVTGLPESERCTNIWVVVDRFTKMAHFTPLKEKLPPQ